MRVLHEPRPEETPVCQGEYRYLKGGKPAGQTEQWTIMRLPNGGEVVRAEVSGADPNRPTSLLTHLQRHPEGKPEWLRLRFENKNIRAAAQYTFEDAVVRVVRQTENRFRRQEVVDIATGYVVDYPPVIGHEFVWRGYPSHARGKPWAIPVFSPDLWTEDEGGNILAGRSLRFNVKPLGVEGLTTSLGDFEQARCFEITLDDGVKAIAWYDDFGIPLRWTYPDRSYDFVLVAYEREG